MADRFDAPLKTTPSLAEAVRRAFAKAFVFTGRAARAEFWKFVLFSVLVNLVLIVIFSGYENFVSRMNLDAHEDRPNWQGEVDFSGLKLKLVASIVAISGIHLLKVFMDVGKYAPDQIRWMVVIHLVFVVSGVLLAAMDWIANHGKGLKKRAPKA